MPERSCLLCEHFVLDMGSPAYSDMTPGEPAEVKCSKGCWKIEGEDQVDEDTLRAHMTAARDCEQYEHHANGAVEEG